MMKENCCTFYKADKLNLQMCISATRDVSARNKNYFYYANPLVDFIIFTSRHYQSLLETHPFLNYFLRSLFITISHTRARMFLKIQERKTNLPRLLAKVTVMM